MLVTDFIVGIEKLEGICVICLNFIVYVFSGLFSHSLIFSTKYSQSTSIANYILSDIWYWLNSNILESSEDIIKSQKCLFLYTFSWDSCLFSIEKEQKQFRQQKLPCCLEVIPVNNAASVFTAS